MLAPGQIKGYQFQSAGQGAYRADEVDHVFSAVADAYEKLYNENGDLIKRVNLLADKVKAYREEEELIKKTLLMAQKQADELDKSSRERSEALISGAQKEYDEKTAAAEKRSQEMLAASEERARKLLSEANQRSADTLRGASETAEKTLATARGKAAMMLSEAKTRAEKMLNDAQSRSNEILGSIKGEVESEKKALETVRAQSREFKKKLTESYYEQIGMTTQMLDFVESEESVAADAENAAQTVETVDAPAAVAVPAEEPEVTPAFSVDATYLQDDDDLFTSVLEELVSDDEPVDEAPAAAEPVIETQAEPEVEDVSSFSESEPAAPAEEAPQGFSFVGGFGAFSAPANEEAPEIEDVPVAGIDDIFSSALSQSAAAPAEPKPVEEATMEFGGLKEKYASAAPADPEPVQSGFGGFSAKMNSMLPDDLPEPPTRSVPMDTFEDDEPAAPVEEAPAKHADNPEKKRHRLSLFARYEDDDEDEDDDDDDDEDDDDDDDDDDGGFRGFFRKS